MTDYCILELEHASSLPDAQCLMLVHIHTRTHNTVSAMIYKCNRQPSPKGKFQRIGLLRPREQIST